MSCGEVHESQQVDDSKKLRSIKYGSAQSARLGLLERAGPSRTMPGRPAGKRAETSQTHGWIRGRRRSGGGERLDWLLTVAVIFSLSIYPRATLRSQGKDRSINLVPTTRLLPYAHHTVAGQESEYTWSRLKRARHSASTNQQRATHTPHVR
jgi:hypothetical protein